MEAITILLRAFALLADMDINVLADGRVEILDIPMHGVSDPYEVADAAYHCAAFFAQDGRAVPADLEALARTGSIWAKLNPVLVATHFDWVEQNGWTH